MSIWITMQLALLLCWVVAGFLFFRKKAWKISVPFNISSSLIMIFRFVALGWLLSSICLGVFYVLYTVPFSGTFPIITLLVFPIIIIFILAINYYFGMTDQKGRERLILQKTKECKEWVEQFPFINNEMVNIKIYLSNGAATGRLIISDVDANEAALMSGKKEELPDDIHLMIVVNNDENTSSLSDNSIYH